MPLACLGLAGFASLRGAGPKRAAAWAAAACALLSAFVNLLGALHGAMLCYFPHFAVGRYLSEMRDGGLHTHPLALWLAPPLAVCAALFARTLAARELKVKT